jgi:hypothetical protein
MADRGITCAGAEGRVHITARTMSVRDGRRPMDYFHQVEDGLADDAKLLVAGGRTTPVPAPAGAAFGVLAVPVGVGVQHGGQTPRDPGGVTGW